MKIGMRLPALVAVAALLFGVSVPARAQSQNDAAAIAIGEKDIGGVVSSPQSREAGVWIIAETTELPTQFRRIVVTDDQGRYLIPDLPQADYSVWVRGYGLIDSPKMRAKPGQPARSRRRAGTECRGCGALLPGDLLVFAPDDPGQERLRRRERHSRQRHAAGLADGRQEPVLRRLSPARAGVDAHDSFRLCGSEDQYRCLDAAHPVGPGGPVYGEPARRATGRGPVQGFRRLDGPHCQGRTAAGEAAATARAGAQPRYHRMGLGLARQVPARPDLDRQARPTVNANGKEFGSPEYAGDDLPILDPQTNTVTVFHAPVRDPAMPMSLGEGHAATEKPVMPSAYWGDRQIWDTRVNNHNMMIDRKGRVWLTAAVRGRDNPAFCKEGSDHPRQSCSR